MATLLSICTRAARGTGILLPSAISGSNDETAERLLEAAQTCGELMMRRHSWIVLAREHTFATVNGTAEYALPSDFDRILADSAWQTDNYLQMRGNLTPGQWQWRENALVSTPTLQKAFRIRVSTTTKKLYLTPTPEGAEDVTFEYVSTGWCTSSGGTRQSAWAADSDILLLDEAVFVLGTRALFKQSNGLPHLADMDLFERQMRAAIAQELALQPINLARSAMDQMRVTAPIPEGNWGL